MYMNNSRLFFSPGKPLLQGLLLTMTINLSTKCNMYVYIMYMNNSRLFFSPGKPPENLPGKTTGKALD